MLISPSIDEAQRELASGIEARKLILMVASCSVEYSGRTGSHLGEGERLVIVKGDGCIMVHRGRDYQPVNWQPSGCVIQSQNSDGILVVKAVRPNPLESLTLNINAIQFLGTFVLQDHAEFVLHASEEEMQRAIILQPDVIEPGFKILDYEKKVPPGFVDVFGVDVDGNLVVIEIKKDPAGFPVVKQLLEYVKYLQAPAGKKLRAMIVAPSIAKGSQATLAKSGIEFRQLSLQKAVEILQKYSKSDQQALKSWL
ncbi:MAG TPA: endonuclease NucS [Candidatus Bathyarchaeia archaeon]|nr:endonuclease NucS [Candidatus Bathyarchaeia archaeon]